MMTTVLKNIGFAASLLVALCINNNGSYAQGTDKELAPDSNAIPSIAALKTQAETMARPPAVHASLYPGDYEFKVYRKGKKIGFHKVEFEKIGNETIVYNDMQIRVKILFITAYKLIYQSRETWTGDTLAVLNSNINNNGKKLFMGGNITEGDFTWVDIDGGAKASPIGDGTFPTNHWYISVLDEEKLLNTLTGKQIDVAITSEGQETIKTYKGSMQAERFRYSGELTNVVWYDRYGRWVGLEFTAQDGSTIEYRCVGCEKWGAPEGYELPLTEISR